MTLSTAAGGEDGMRYYFHLIRGHEMLQDETGLVLDDETEIGDGIAAAIREIARDKGALDADWREWSIRVVDEAGVVIVEVPLLSFLG